MAKIFPKTTIAENTFQVSISLEDALGYINGILPLHFDEMIDDVMNRTPTLCTIQTGYRLLNIDKLGGDNASLHIDGIQFQTQQIVTSQLKNVDQAILFLCTIGSGMELWSKQLAGEGDPSMSYFVDTVASVIVETTADVLHNYLIQDLKLQGLNVTNRYSPGYCDWSVEEQKKLFSFLPKGFCGISLTDSALMIPMKSISGIIGVGKNVVYRQYFCDTCGRKDCTYKAFRERSSKPFIKGNEP
jgi:hypothetical protein